jgi:hypothetical protein
MDATVWRVVKLQNRLTQKKKKTANAANVGDALEPKESYRLLKQQKVIYLHQDQQANFCSTAALQKHFYTTLVIKLFQWINCVTLGNQ